ncbi:hypothetical protein DFJ74DRAFT_731300 [Hyaloraphidium curvatum]|nr:hypothetical protein DFJ74DRAFT_731300 [Hyaloraphidium curvatum]
MPRCGLLRPPAARALALLLCAALLLPLLRPAPPPPFHLAIVTIATQNASAEPWVRASLADKWAYARRHDGTRAPHSGTLQSVRFRPVLRNVAGKKWHPVWAKWVAAYRVLAELETAPPAPAEAWVWLLDLDTVLTNHDVAPADLLRRLAPPPAGHPGPTDPRIRLIASRDCNSLNAGSLLLRLLPSSPSSKTLLEHLFAQRARERLPYREQEGLRALLHPSTVPPGAIDLSGAAAMVRQEEMNAYPPPNACVGVGSRGWERGDPVAHFPACAVEGDPPAEGAGGRYKERLRWKCGDWAEYLMGQTVGRRGREVGAGEEPWVADAVGDLPGAARKLGFVDMGDEDDGDWVERQKKWEEEGD